MEVATKFTTLTKNSYAMHTIKLLLTSYLNISVQAANLSDCRIESNRNLFCPNWNALVRGTNAGNGLTTEHQTYEQPNTCSI